MSPVRSRRIGPSRHARRCTPDAVLLRAVDAALEANARSCGAWLACRPGCTECCQGPFSINHLDVARLRRGLAALERSEPRRAAAVRVRAAAAIASLRADFPGDPDSGILDDDEAAVDAFSSRHHDMMCPALDPATGRCDLYAARPLTCRMFGPPLRVGTEELPPCRLCFRGASAAEIERCRVDPDPGGREDALLAAFEARGGPAGETLVAYALPRVPGQIGPIRRIRRIRPIGRIGPIPRSVTPSARGDAT